MFSIACFAGLGASRYCPPTVPGPNYTTSCVPLAATVGVLPGRPPTPDTELVSGSDLPPNARLDREAEAGGQCSQLRRLR